MTDKIQQEIEVYDNLVAESYKREFRPFSERLWEQKTAELAKVKKQLAISVEALETINVCCDECSFRASYALHKIEELEK